MRFPPDLFRRNKDGKYIWLEAGEDLKAAKLRLQELSASAPGSICYSIEATRKSWKDCATTMSATASEMLGVVEVMSANFQSAVPVIPNSVYRFS